MSWKRKGKILILNLLALFAILLSCFIWPSKSILSLLWSGINIWQATQIISAVIMLIKRQWNAFFLFDSMWEEKNTIGASEDALNFFCHNSTRRNLSKWEERYQNTEPKVVSSCGAPSTLRLTAKKYRFDTFKMLEVRTMLIFFHHKYITNNKSSLLWG